MAMLLLHAHATVTLCHSRTQNLAEVTRQAEVLVVAAGKRTLVGADYVGKGAVVVDVGMHRVSERDEVERLFPGNQKRLATFEKKGSILVGDVDFTQVAEKASRITPVPGGVGPLTIAMLMANTVRAARIRRDL
jgi:methylenetetrahydrofolate dehydrogenase (NADP+)/methenyltetrahydrofolate cyclohydrolase